AALFLKEFVGDTQWAHLDIAGPSDAMSDSGYLTRGGTAFSLRTILRYLREL
ncbi:MAG: leucyl aminopeptidase, partial [Actinomycetes bacterium]